MQDEDKTKEQLIAELYKQTFTTFPNAACCSILGQAPRKHHHRARYKRNSGGGSSFTDKSHSNLLHRRVHLPEESRWMRGGDETSPPIHLFPLPSVIPRLVLSFDERLGSPRTVKVDVRIISVTNRDLAGVVSEGGFR